MKTRSLIIMASLTICGLSVGGVVWQSRQLSELRDDGRQLRQQLDDLRAEKDASAERSATTQPALNSPSAELLRLRSQVSQLARRERELAGVQTENQRLQTQVAAARTNKTQLPTSYIRKSEARNLGFATPDSTLETFLWSIQNRDLNSLLACFTPEAADKFRQQFEQSGKSAEKFFDGSKGLPGINVLDRTTKSDDVIESKVEMVPGSGADGPSMPFRRVNGEWKLADPR